MCSAGWWHLVLSMLSVTTAMLCKEQGITITGICAVYELIVAQKVNVSLSFFCDNESINNVLKKGGKVHVSSDCSSYSSAVTSGKILSVHFPHLRCH
jgi:hypothetical protein